MAATRQAANADGGLGCGYFIVGAALWLVTRNVVLVGALAAGMVALWALAEYVRAAALPEVAPADFRPTGR